MRFSVLASGSKGNACYIETSNTRLLIDAGLSCRELLRRLDMVGVGTDRLDAIVITHEHQDHIKGAGPVSRKFNSPVYSNCLTMEKSRRTLGDIAEFFNVDTGDSLVIEDITVETFSKSHDAADPLGLVVSSNGSRLGIITDLGESTLPLEEKLKNCTAVLIEFNHDTEMLSEGPYPFYLKKRIRSPYGHLSNEQACELLKKLAHKRLSKVILAHISEINNKPEKALLSAKRALIECGLDDLPVYVSYQDYPCPLMEI